jgi:hypothetical protein
MQTGRKKKRFVISIGRLVVRLPDLLNQTMKKSGSCLDIRQKMLARAFAKAASLPLFISPFYASAFYASAFFNTETLYAR